MSAGLTIAVDAMSGDHGAAEAVPAALDVLAASPDLRLIIVGRGEVVRPLVAGIDPDRCRVVEASEVVAMDEKPQEAVRRKKDSSMRGAIDRGTATAIRSRYGIQADVAGKTGTTQDNTDGWFILMHARVVAGAWAGFNDGRITLRSDHWGQGARSALPMVGEFVQQAIRSKAIDGNARFVDEFATAPPMPSEPPPVDAPLGSMRDWIRGLFRNDAPAPQPSPAPAPWPIGPARPPEGGAPRAPSGRPVPAEEWGGG